MYNNCTPTPESRNRILLTASQLLCIVSIETSVVEVNRTSLRILSGLLVVFAAEFILFKMFNLISILAFWYPILSILKHRILKHKNAIRFCEINQGFCLKLLSYISYFLQVYILYYKTRTYTFITIFQIKMVINYCYYLIHLAMEQASADLSKIKEMVRWSYGFLLNPNKKCSVLNVTTWRSQIETCFLINLQELYWVMTLNTVKWKKFTFWKLFRFQTLVSLCTIDTLARGFWVN